MNTTQRYFFKKEDKLKSRKAIDALFGKGKNFSNFPLKVIWIPFNSREVLQAGVGVSSRNFKKAADRNRIKRLLREAYRLHKNILKESLKESNRSMSVFFYILEKSCLNMNLFTKKWETL